MPIPPTSISLLRSEMHVTRPVVNIFPAETVVTGTVTSTITTYPIGEFSVTWNSGAWANTRVGQLFIVTDATTHDVVTYGVLRKSPTSTTLYCDGKARGDAGIAVRRVYGITAGQIVTVYTYQPLWALLSRIKDGQFYKKFDIPYNGSGNNPPPVLNIGAWRQVWADELTGLGRLTLSAANSFAWLTKTIVSYSWTLPVGAVVISGSISSDTLVIDLPQGFHRILCTITDSVDAVTSGMRPVWVNGDTYPPISDLNSVEIGSDSQDRSGRNISITAHGKIDYTILPGAAFHLSEEALYNGEPLDDGVLVSDFVGFSQETSTYDLVQGEMKKDIEIQGPWAWLAIIPMVSQAIVETVSPSTWTDVASGLGTPNFIAWYILKHHSTYLDMFDYFPLTESNPPRKLNWGINGSTVAEYLQQAVTVFGGNVGCVSDGAIYMRRDPNIELETFRSAVDTRMTIYIDPENEISDIISPVEYPENFFNETGQIRLFALVYDGTATNAYASIAPGYQQMQAAGSSDEDSFIVKPVADSYFLANQEAVNWYAGQLLAKQNSPTKELSLALNRNMDIINPAKMLWFRVDVPAEWSPEGKAIDNLRVLPVSVDRSWEQTDGGSWIKNITVIVTPETVGQYGETYNIDKGGAVSQDPEELPIEDEIVEAIGFAAAINANGKFGRTYNGAEWESIIGAIKGKSQDFCLDPFSPFSQSGYSEGAQAAWCISARVSSIVGVYDTVEIYRSANILAQNPTWTLQYAYSAGCDMLGSCRIIANNEFSGCVAAAMNTDSGVFTALSINGLNFTTVAVGTVPTTGFDRTNDSIDIVYNGEQLITSGFDSSGTYGFYLFQKPTTGSGNFTFIVDSPRGDIAWPALEVDDTYLYASKVAHSIETRRTKYEYYVANSGGTPVVTKKKTIYPDLGAPIVSYDPTEMIVDISNDTVGTLNTPTVLTAHSGVGTFDWRYYSPLALADTPITSGGWLAKNEGYTIKDTGVTLTFRLWGKGSLYDSYILGWVLSKDSDPNYLAGSPPNDWGATMYRFFFEGSTVFYLYSGELCCGCLKPMYPDAFFPNIYFDWRTTLECGSQNNNNPVLNISKTSISTAVGSGGKSEPYLITSGSVTYESYETFMPVLYRSAKSSLTVFDDITPNDGTNDFVPMNFYSMAADPANSGVVNAVVVGAGQTRRIATSTDYGTTWTIAAEGSFYWGVRQVDMFGLSWGYNVIEYTEDGFATVTDISGNWTTTIDPNPAYFVAVKAVI